MTLHFEGSVEEFTAVFGQPGGAALSGILAKLDGLSKESLMVDQSIQDLAKKFDTATNAIAARLQALIDKANQAGTLASQEIAAFLQPEVDKLTALGQDPSNPVPANQVP